METGPPPHLRRALLLLASAGFVSGLSIRVAEPLLPKVAHDFHSSVGAASVLITGFTLAYGAFQLVHGPVGDRIGKLRAVAVALVLAAAASAACSLATSLPALAATRFLSGMTAGAIIPLSLAYVGDNVRYEERQPVLARFIAGVLLGQVLGPLLGGVFGDFVGWRGTFLVPAALFLAVAALLAPTARRHGRAAPATGPPVGVLARYRSLLRRPRVRTILAATAAEGFLFFGAFGFLGAFLRHEFALRYTAIGLLLAGYGLGGMAYSALVRPLVRRLGQRGLVAAGGVLHLACFAAIAAAPSWEACLPAIVLLGLAFYMLHNTLQTRATEMAPEARGAAVSLFAFCLFTGQTAGVTAVGAAIGAHGYRPLFAGAGVAMCLLGLWLRRALATL